MTPDETHVLQRAGQWPAALAATSSPRRRAEILTDRHGWRLDPAGEALDAIDAIRPTEPRLAALLFGQIVYWHRLAGLGPPDTYGSHDPADGFAEVAADPALTGWAAFWHGVTLENLHGNAAAAAGHYERARSVAVAGGDRLLESYAVRHQGSALLDRDRPAGVLLLRRSLQLRAACGARPHVAAAQRVLARALAGTDEARMLDEIADATAVELDLTWLRPAR